MTCGNSGDLFLRAFGLLSQVEFHVHFALACFILVDVYQLY